jgi:hypothetical protein
MHTKVHKLEGASELSGIRPRPNPKVYARSHLTNGKDLLPNIDGRSLIALLDRQPVGARDRFRVSRQTAIAVGREPQAAAQRSGEGLRAQPSLKADIDHKELFPVVTNPAAPGAIAGTPVSDSADSADPSRPLADAVRAMLADAARRQRGPK